MIDSDIALTTFQGAESGLTVFARSYATRQAAGGVKLTLVARNNNELATVTTDSDGRADFDAGLFSGNRRRRAGGGDGLWRRRGFQLPRSAPPGLRSDRPRRGRPRARPARSMRFSIPSAASIAPARRCRRSPCCATASALRMTAPLTLVAHASRWAGSRPHDRCRRIARGGQRTPGRSNSAHTAPHGRWQIAAYIDPKATAWAACSSTLPISCRSG